MGKSANLPAPYGGMNSKTPKAALTSPYCESLLNFNTTSAGIELRNGDSVWGSTKNIAPATTDTFYSFIKYGDTKLFYTARTNAGTTRYFDITATGTPSLSHTSASAITGGEMFSLYFNKRVFTFGSTSSVGDYYDGSAWGTWGYTFTSISPIGGCAYQNRAYFIGRDSATYSYGGISAVTGATTEVDLAGVLLEQSYLSTIAPVTIANAGQTLQVLAFAFFSGEVLFYSGLYPDSPTWSLAGRGRIGKPLNYNSSIDYQGDSLIMTRTGLVSLRDVYLSGGQQATTKTVSEAIDTEWIELVSATISGSIFYDSGSGRILYTTGDWWQSKNRIVIGFPTVIDQETGDILSGAYYFVLDTLRNSWSTHSSSGVTALLGLTDFRDSLFICGNFFADSTNYLVIGKKEGASDFQDASRDGTTKTSYNYEFLSAPIPFAKTAVYEATGIEPILESDMYEETNWNLIADFGKQTSGDQKTDALTTSIAKPMANVGMQNITYVQVKMSGTTAASKTVGLDLYSYNVWYDSGQEASR